MEANHTIKSMSTSSAPSAVGPYSQGILAGKTLYISGQLPLDPETGDFASGGIEEWTHQVIKNVRAIAEAAGAGLDRVVKTTIFLTDMGNFSAVNNVYAQYFNEPLPARCAIQVAGLPKDADIEMEAIVYLP